MKPLRQSNPTATATATTRPYSNDEPIYENLNKFTTSTTTTPKTKQYSVRDVFTSLKSLELTEQAQHAHEQDDELCDQEVDFYLNRDNFAHYFDFNSYVNSHKKKSHHQKIKTPHSYTPKSSCKSSMMIQANYHNQSNNNINNCSRPVALWEQLV